MAYRRIHDTIPTSPSCNACSKMAHAMWPHLSYAVNLWGRGYDSPRWLLNKLFPEREDFTAKEISEWLDEWARTGMIVRYTVGKRRFFQIVNFDVRQADAVAHRKKLKQGPDIPAPADDSVNLPEDFQKIDGRLPEEWEKTSRSRANGSAPPFSVFQNSSGSLPEEFQTNLHAYPHAEPDPQPDPDPQPACIAVLGKQAGKFDVEVPVCAEFQRIFPVECQSKIDRDKFNVYREKLGDEVMLEIIRECEHARIRDGSVGFGLLMKLCRKGCRGERICESNGGSPTRPPEPTRWTITPEQAALESERVDMSKP